MARTSLFHEALRADADRALSAWFAAPDRREGLWLLAAIDGELGRIAARGTEPMLHSILYQFWREALLDAHGGGHPLVLAARGAFATSTTLTDGLATLVDAHEAASHRPAEGERAVRSEARRQSILFELADRWLAQGHGGPDLALLDACGDIWGAVRFAAGQCRHGQTEGDQSARLAALAAGVYERIRPQLATISPERRPAFLPLALVSSYLPLLTKPGRPIAEPVAPCSLSRLLRLWQAARRGF
jgi:phytoene/squalene synthetase